MSEPASGEQQQSDGAEKKPQEIARELELKNELLEKEVMSQRSAAEEAAQLVLQFKRQLQNAALTVERKAEAQQSRIDFLTRTLNASEHEKARLQSQLRNFQNEAEAQKEKFDLKVETLMFQSKEAQAGIKDKIQAALQQLRNLRQFQEHKHQMDEKMRNLGALIAKERKERTAEIAAFHRKLVAQREFYEKQLANGLIQADEFSTRFNDVDLDRVTTKLLHETEQRREALKAESALTNEVVKRNDQLRHQLQDLEQQKKVLQESEKNLTMQSVDLKGKVEETSKKVEESLALSRDRLEQLKMALSNRIKDLTNRLEDQRKQRELLKRELVLAEARLARAEEQREARLKKDADLLGVANEAALFILTSLELQERDPTKEQVTAQSSALNAVIRKINNISQDLTGVEPKTAQDPAQSQTGQTVKKWVASGKAESPPRTRAFLVGKKTEDFRSSPEYQRIFGKDAGSSASTTAKGKMLRIIRTGNR